MSTASQRSTGDETMIRLRQVSKTYAGADESAVDSLDLEVTRGEILVLVGPSGCGKSTTLRLINRMIEPSSGRIIFEGEDVTDINADKLRRRIGYVIQQIGLFPHMTIGDNVATVPRMLKWDRKRIKVRADELLDLVGLDPDQYRDRYPNELSGGQAQRAGVARALGADPDVMLMDEPFGAIDPITRDRLQNEFLRLQEELQKTIVFVTHDIDEAIKMGDRIAILREQAHIAQLDTPQRILARPADEFVADFIGSGSTLKGLHFRRVRDLDLPDYPTVPEATDPDTARRLLSDSPHRWLLVVDDQQRPINWINEDHLDHAGPLSAHGPRVVARVEPNATLHDTLEEMLVSSTGSACAVSKDGRLEGVVQIESLTEIIAELRAEAAKSAEPQR